MMKIVTYFYKPILLVLIVSQLSGCSNQYVTSIIPAESTQMENQQIVPTAAPYREEEQESDEDFNGVIKVAYTNEPATGQGESLIAGEESGIEPGNVDGDINESIHEDRKADEYANNSNVGTPSTFSGSGDFSRMSEEEIAAIIKSKASLELVSKSRYRLLLDAERDKETGKETIRTHFPSNLALGYIIGDFNDDGLEELVIPTLEYVEYLEGEDTENSYAIGLSVITKEKSEYGLRYSYYGERQLFGDCSKYLLAAPLDVLALNTTINIFSDQDGSLYIETYTKPSEIYEAQYRLTKLKFGKNDIKLVGSPVFLYGDDIEALNDMLDVITNKIELTNTQREELDKFQGMNLHFFNIKEDNSIYTRNMQLSFLMGVKYMCEDVTGFSKTFEAFRNGESNKCSTSKIVFATDERYKSLDNSDKSVGNLTLSDSDSPTSIILLEYKRENKFGDLSNETEKE